MSTFSARAAARVLGAAAGAGAEFVSPADFTAAVGSDQPEASPPRPVHLALHFVGDDAAAPLLLAAAEREEGVLGTYLLPVDRPESVTVAPVLRKLGHSIGAWLTSDGLAQETDATQCVSEFAERLRSSGIRELKLVATNAEGDAEELSALCRRTGVESWASGSRCGGPEARQSLYHVSDGKAGWTLACTSPAYAIGSATPNQLTGDFLTWTCDASARGTCIYSLTADLYG